MPSLPQEPTGRATGLLSPRKTQLRRIPRTVGNFAENAPLRRRMSQSGRFRPPEIWIGFAEILKINPTTPPGRNFRLFPQVSRSREEPHRPAGISPNMRPYAKGRANRGVGTWLGFPRIAHPNSQGAIHTGGRSSFYIKPNFEEVAAQSLALPKSRPLLRSWGRRGAYSIFGDPTRLF